MTILLLKYETCTSHKEDAVVLLGTPNSLGEDVRRTQQLIITLITLTNSLLGNHFGAICENVK